jgi:hypothetical protein
MEMSDDETRAEDEVEAHRHGHGNLAHDEGKTEGESDDVEAHRHGHGNLAHDEGKTEGESDDDFEAHRHSLKFRTGHK